MTKEDNISSPGVGNIDELFNDPRFLRIKRQLSQPNIFNILSNATNEIRHSNFIAWLLNADETHDSGTLFSKRIIQILAPGIKDPNRNWTVYREKDNLDILLYSGRETICVENKTKSKDSPGQLSGYRHKVKKKYAASENIFYTYLTLSGEDPLDTTEKTHWHTCSYSEILKVLKSALAEHKNIIPEKTRLYISDYVTAVETLSTKTHQINSDAISIAAEKKYKLMEIFNELEDKDQVLSPQYKVLKFIKENSSFTRGKGFFRPTNFFYEAFKNALEKYNFIVDEGQSNSTYLKFSSKNMVHCLQEPTLSDTVSMSFRFFDKNSKLHFGMGLTPETSENKKLRDKIRNHIPLIRREFQDNAVSSRGLNHIGLFIKKVEFNPLSCHKGNVGIEVDKLIATQIEPEQQRLETVIRKILAR